MDDTRSPGRPSELDDKSDRVVRERVDPLRNGHFTWAENLLGNPFAPGSEAGMTVVRELMKAPLGRLGRVALALIGKFPAEEVTANLHRLKQVMETGKVTDTSYSVRGKFFEHLK